MNDVELPVNKDKYAKHDKTLGASRFGINFLNALSGIPIIGGIFATGAQHASQALAKSGGYTDADLQEIINRITKKIGTLSQHELDTVQDAIGQLSFRNGSQAVRNVIDKMKSNLQKRSQDLKTKIANENALLTKAQNIAATAVDKTSQGKEARDALLEIERNVERTINGGDNNV